MAGRDDGEFELILGNKQLLSVLFIVIVLLGVFFAMGFLAGRTTGAGPVTAQSDPQDRQPLAVDSASSRAPLVTSENPEAAPDRPAESPVALPEVGKEIKAEPPAPKQAVEPPAAKAAPVASPKPDAGGFVAAPPAGLYLQAAATRRADAEAMLAGIRSKTGLAGYVAPVPKSTELFRVLVGPLKSKAQQAEARMALGEIGVKSPFSVTY